MKLKRLAIDRLPGIDQPFEIESSGTGVHVVFGPNAIGKSSICRAVESLYWDDRGPTQRIFVTGQFELDGEEWWAERDGPRRQWRCAEVDGVQPQLPASHNHRYFFLSLRDLIDPSRDGTQEIASEIRRQMSGGFDLDRIAEVHFSGIGRRHGRRQRDDFNAAHRAVQEAEGEQRVLQRRMEELGALEAELETASTAARRLPWVQRAVGHAERAEEHARILEELAALPDALANLTGREVDHVEELQARIVTLNEQARELAGNREAARAAIRDSRLPGKVDRSKLAIWRQDAEELGRRELELQTATIQRGECRKELGAALSAMGGSDAGERVLTLEEHGRLFEFLRTAESLRTEKSAIEWRMRLLVNIEQSDSGESRLEDLLAAVDVLRRWLRAPQPDTIQDRFRTRRGWILLAVAMAVAGTVMAVFVEPSFGLFLAAGVGVFATAILLRNANPTASTRSHEEEAFTRIDVDSPEDWEPRSVEARLRSLELEVASIDSWLQRARNRDVDRRALESQLNGLVEAETSLEERRKSLLENLRLDSMQPDAELVDVARALDQLRAARIKYEGAAGRVDELEAKHSRLLSDLAEVLQRHGEPPAADATSAKIYLGNLSDRSSQLVKAVTDERQAVVQLEGVSADQDTARHSVEQIYAQACLDEGDLPGLTALLNLLPQYRELKERASRLESQIDLDRDELAKVGEAELAERDRATLDRMVRDLSAAAEKADDLRGEIADINAQVSEAKRGSNLQDLIARQQQARTGLQDRRDEALFARAGKFLVEAVEQEYEQNQMPRVFERARDHFSQFTHHGYELRLSRAAGAPRLFAADLRSGENRKLNELSDGTRAQLLLAARMAFAEEVERGITLPLFLDEALDQSDPARFEAIAHSLGRIANDQGRQIFYLTSDPLDCDRIRHALDDDAIVADIDLGSIRAGAMAVTEPATLRVPPRTVIPTPDGASPEQYAVSLRVPAFTPGLGYARQHFFYLLSDDLDLLHTFLVNGIEQAGQWQTVSGTLLAERLGSRSLTSQEIDSRVSLLEVFCEAWMQGRGRAVDRDVLVQSGAVSERFLDDVTAIARELGGGSERLVGALRARNDPRLKGFRHSSVNDLEEYLRDNGYLDDRPTLEENELRVRALASPPANALADGVGSTCLTRWWSWATQDPVGAG